jgi:energy-coupling factor transporter ATP-binding protein EcfA2
MALWQWANETFSTKALARAIYARARLLVLDNVLSALDKKTADSIFRNLFGRKGIVRRSTTTVVFATHDLDYLRTADLTIMLDGEGHVTMASDLAKSDLPLTFVAQIGENISCQRDEKFSAEGEIRHGGCQPVRQEEKKSVRQGGDFLLYKCFFAATPSWLVVLWILGVFCWTAAENIPCKCQRPSSSSVHY